ncbi:MAG: thioredoxin domain-containing protein [bacterium]|nr:thioredoxin domain-containing protein [bacterium]
MKFTYKSGRLFATIVLASVFATGCGDEPYVEVDGTKYFEADLAKSSPSSYKAMRDEYNQQLVNALGQLATDKLFAAEAKKQSKTKEEYMSDLRKKVQPPTEAEMRSMYARLKESGQIGAESYEQVSDRIAQFMLGQSQQEVMQAEIARLKKDYGYKVYSGPIVRQEVAVDDDPVRSNPNAKVTIIEFSDFECPYCTRVQETATQIRANYGDKIKWVVKDFPLSFHEKAMAAHVAANCVLLQDKDKYWEFFDGLFAADRAPNYLDPDQLASLAGRVGANMKDYNMCMTNSDAMEAEVKADIAQGEGVGVRGTPAFFINGRFVSGALPYADFDAIIKEELN